jgi:hypothetical protein
MERQNPTPLMESSVTIVKLDEMEGWERLNKKVADE